MTLCDVTSRVLLSNNDSVMCVCFSAQAPGDLSESVKAFVTLRPFGSSENIQFSKAVVSTLIM